MSSRETTLQAVVASLLAMGIEKLTRFVNQRHLGDMDDQPQLDNHQER